MYSFIQVSEICTILQILCILAQQGKISYDKDELSYYIGDWVDNKKCGRGFRQYPTGSTYEGEWFENLRHGKGTMRWAGTGESYTGQWNMGIQVC